MAVGGPCVRRSRPGGASLSNAVSACERVVNTACKGALLCRGPCTRSPVYLDVNFYIPTQTSVLQIGRVGLKSSLSGGERV